MKHTTLHLSALLLIFFRSEVVSSDNRTTSGSVSIEDVQVALTESGSTSNDCKDGDDSPHCQGSECSGCADITSCGNIKCDKCSVCSSVTAKYCGHLDNPCEHPHCTFAHDSCWDQHCKRECRSGNCTHGHCALCSSCYDDFCKTHCNKFSSCRDVRCSRCRSCKDFFDEKCTSFLTCKDSRCVHCPTCRDTCNKLCKDDTQCEKPWCQECPRCRNFCSHNCNTPGKCASFACRDCENCPKFCQHHCSTREQCAKNPKCKTCSTCTDQCSHPNCDFCNKHCADVHSCKNAVCSVLCKEHCCKRCSSSKHSDCSHVCPPPNPCAHCTSVHHCKDPACKDCSICARCPPECFTDLGCLLGSCCGCPACKNYCDKHCRHPLQCKYDPHCNDCPTCKPGDQCEYPCNKKSPCFQYPDFSYDKHSFDQYSRGCNEYTYHGSCGFPRSDCGYRKYAFGPRPGCSCDCKPHVKAQLSAEASSDTNFKEDAVKSFSLNDVPLDSDTFSTRSEFENVGQELESFSTN